MARHVIEPVFGVAGSGLIVIAHLLHLAATKAAKARRRHIRVRARERRRL
jgi:hypothetical protein